MCGLVKREGLADVDVGFALRSRYWSRGYAVEAAAAVLDYAKRTLNLGRIVAIVNPGNHASISVLERIGLKFERMIRLSGDAAEVKLFGPAP
jgi:RimJ/RimL family protein N-acetyltransferase